MRAAVLVALAACGRLHFDRTSAADAASDAPDLDCPPARLVDAPYANSSEGADGTTTPYVICTAAQLDQIGRHSADWAAHFRLGHDLDLATTPVTMIGDATTSFTGAFDGGGHTIAHLMFDFPMTTGVGLFAALGAGAHVANLTLSHVSVSGGDNTGALVGFGDDFTLDAIAVDGIVTGGTSVGGVVGDAECTTLCAIENVSSAIGLMSVANGGGIVGSITSGTLTATSSSGTVYGGSSVGGLVGLGQLTPILSSSSSAAVDATMQGGGLVGTAIDVTGTIDRSTATGTVTCGDGTCGGIAGYAEGSMSQVHAGGHVKCTLDFCGGLVGQAGGPIAECSATGGVEGRDYIGGLVGDTTVAELHDAFATGTVTGRNDVGGLVGIQEDSVAITRTYSTATVSGSDYVGGLVGQLGAAGTTASVVDSFATGSVTGMSANMRVSLLSGGTLATSAPITNCFYASTATCTNPGTGCHVAGTAAVPTTFYLRANAPLASWDFSTIWQEVASSYPVLQK